jgi:hypothetical protein
MPVAGRRAIGVRVMGKAPSIATTESRMDDGRRRSRPAGSLTAAAEMPEQRLAEPLLEPERGMMTERIRRPARDRDAMAGCLSQVTRPLR